MHVLHIAQLTTYNTACSIPYMCGVWLTGSVSFICLECKQQLRAFVVYCVICELYMYIQKGLSSFFAQSMCLKPRQLAIYREVFYLISSFCKHQTDNPTKHISLRVVHIICDCLHTIYTVYKWNSTFASSACFNRGCTSIRTHTHSTYSLSIPNINSANCTYYTITAAAAAVVS